MEFDFNGTTLLNEYLEQKRVENGERQPPNRTFYCSELGYCPRKLYYKRVIPKKASLETEKIFELGDLLHEYGTMLLKWKYGSDHVSSEGNASIYLPSEDIRFGGRYDDLLSFDGNYKIVIEKKSARALGYIKKASSHHALQAMMYMKALGASKAFVWYIGKNDLGMKCHEVKFDSEEFQQAIDKIVYVQACLDDGVLPEKQPIGKWECDYCSWKEECARNLVDVVSLKQKKEE